MKNSHKKISAVVLAGMLVFGGVVVNGVNSFAASNNSISKRSFIANNYRGFIGDDKQFREEYEKLVSDPSVVSKEDYKAYEKMIEKIKMIVKELPKGRNFNLGYVGLPGKVEEKLKDKGYKFEHLKSSSMSVRGIISSIYSIRLLQEKNYIVKFNYNNKDYKFIFYGKCK